jgi:hypothetical protein
MRIQILLLFTFFIFCFVNKGTAQEVKINHDGTNGFAVESDGTIRADGAAETWRDELQPLIGQKLDSPSSDVGINFVDFTVDFQVSADYQDVVVMNVQLNHDWDGVTPVRPHLHWFQNQNTTPNWLIGYRWHQNGAAKVTPWTYQQVAINAFPYSSGTILQISEFGDINPPATPTAVSSILQLKLMRDNGNTRTSYSAKDSYSGDAQALSLDIHIQTNTQGSRLEYSK